MVHIKICSFGVYISPLCMLVCVHAMRSSACPSVVLFPLCASWLCGCMPLCCSIPSMCLLAMWLHAPLLFYSLYVPLGYVVACPFVVLFPLCASWLCGCMPLCCSIPSMCLLAMWLHAPLLFYSLYVPLGYVVACPFVVLFPLCASWLCGCMPLCCSIPSMCLLAMWLHALLIVK